MDLIEAVESNNLKMVKELIKAGANLDILDNIGNTALILASYRNNIEIAKELIKAGANVNSQDKYGSTALIYASYKNNIEITKELIKAGADWNLKNYDNDYYFLNYLVEEDKDKIIEEFPEEYENYLIKKDAEKYNL